MPKLATLIGGDGFIGRRLQARMRSEGWTCQVPARDEPWLFRRPLGHVFHCAGLTADDVVPIVPGLVSETFAPWKSSTVSLLLLTLRMISS
jgi:hypothetical protein